MFRLGWNDAQSHVTGKTKEEQAEWEKARQEARERKQKTDSEEAASGAMSDLFRQM